MPQQALWAGQIFTASWASVRCCGAEKDKLMYINIIGSLLYYPPCTYYPAAILRYSHDWYQLKVFSRWEIQYHSTVPLSLFTFYSESKALIIPKGTNIITMRLSMIPITAFTLLATSSAWQLNLFSDKGCKNQIFSTGGTGGRGCTKGSPPGPALTVNSYQYFSDGNVLQGFTAPICSTTLVFQNPFSSAGCTEVGGNGISAFAILPCGSGLGGCWG